jgi:replicative superfamily II helicase
MAAEFVTITKTEMEEWLPDGAKAIERRGYEIDRPGIVVKVYSSIVGEQSRGVGQDAIRCVLFDTFAERPLGKTKRVHRTEGATTVWERLDDRVVEMMLLLSEVTFCPKCGHIMILRNGKFGEFFGCSQFPDCRGTRKSNHVGQGYAERLELAKTFVKVEKDHADPVPDVERKVGEALYPPKVVSDVVDEVPMEFMPVSEFDLIKYPEEWKFQPIQGAVAKLVNHEGFSQNVVISSPTGSGKTLPAEMVIAHCLERMKKKAIYLSPFKALTQEKWDEWQEGVFKDKNISIVTGDYTLTKKRVEELRAADIILLTTEMLDSRTRRMKAEKNDWLLDVGVVVADETHIITMADRGDKTEAGLMRFFKLNRDALLVCISATMPNVDELGKWATVLNGKKTLVLKSTWRPVTLNVHAVPYYSKRYWDAEAEKETLTLDLIKEHAPDKFLVFVHAKRSGYALLRRLRDDGITADFHSADLNLDDRLRIESEFKDRENGIRVLVSTSTTAWGVNLPARRCIIFGVTRGLSPVDPMDIIQEIGRSGRPGLDPEGDAYIICPYDDQHYWANIVENCPLIRSQMLHEDVLGFHICAELGQKPMSIHQIRDWYSRSLAKLQGMDLDADFVEQILKELVRIGCVEYDHAWNNYKLTGLGRVSAWLYYDPWTVAGWFENFKRYIAPEEGSPIEAMKSQGLDEAIAICLANVPAYEMSYVPKDFEAQVGMLARKWAHYFPQFRAGCGTMMLAIAEMLKDGKVSNGLNIFYRQISFDMNRIVQALKLIDNMAGKWGRQEWFEVLGLRVRYGVPEKMIELVKIKGIGGVRAKKLYKEGIKSIADFVKKPKTAKKILKGSYDKVAAHAKELHEKT